MTIEPSRRAVGMCRIMCLPVARIDFCVRRRIRSRGVRPVPFVGSRKVQRLIEGLRFVRTVQAFAQQRLWRVITADGVLVVTGHWQRLSLPPGHEPSWAEPEIAMEVAAR